MAVGALIGAYQESDSGGLRALLPLAGRTLMEYQVRCCAAVGASPIVVLVETLPPALNAAFDRLAAEGLSVIAVSDGVEAASRFEGGDLVLQLADGILPDLLDLQRLAQLDGPAILTVTDDEAHAEHERIDAEHRWAGIAVFDGRSIGATAAMLGDWDLQSTLLRRALQDGVLQLPAAQGPGQGPLLAVGEAEVGGFERRLLLASRAERRDWVSRYLLPVVEEFGTEQLMETAIRPIWLLSAGLGLTLGGAFAFSRGWPLLALGLLLLSLPLDLIARRLARLRLRPMPPGVWAERMMRPAAGLALVSLGWWWTRTSGQYGALVAAVAAVAFAQAYYNEGPDGLPGRAWLFSRRSAVVVAIPFAVAGWWHALLILLAVHAGTSFFLAQAARHRIER